VAWEVAFTDEFAAWWDELTVDEQNSIADGVYVLEEFGPTLTPHRPTRFAAPSIRTYVSCESNTEAAPIAFSMLLTHVVWPCF
jgi:hypothetical protein